MKPGTPTARASGASRRFRFGLLSLVLVACVVVSCVVLNVLAARFNRRWDLTATGEHRLAPRSASTLAGLDAPFEAVIAADLSTLDRRARSDVKDVLDRFNAFGLVDGSGAGGSRLTTRTIDIGSAEGRAAYASLLSDLAVQDAGVFAAGRQRLTVAAESARAVAKEATQILAPGLSQFISGLSMPPGEASTLAAAVRAAADRFVGQARDATLAADAVGPLLTRAIEGVELPALADAAQRLRTPLEALSIEMLRVEGTLRELSSRVPASSAAIAKVAEGVKARREIADSAADSIARLAIPDSLLIADAVGRSPCVLVRRVGPAPTEEARQADSSRLGMEGGGRRPAVRAIPLDDLFSASAASADQRRKAEDLITSAILSISTKVRPIVVYLTAEPALASKSLKIYAESARRLRERGLDTLDWDILQSPEPLGLFQLNPDSSRPVVYVVRVPDTLQEAQGAFASGLDRSRRVAAAAAELADKGASLLIQFGPSLLPVDREPDPIDAVFRRFGLSARSDRTLLSETTGQGTSTRRSVATDLFVDVPESVSRVSQSSTPNSASSAAAIADAVRGLPILLPWATSLRTVESTGGRAGSEGGSGGGIRSVTLLEFPQTPESWAESRWHAFKKVDRAARINVEPPAFTPADDARDGPWIVAAAGELPRTSSTPAQRLVAVASNEWLIDPVLKMSRGLIDGRQVPLAPGNAEFFESSILWLAGQDDAIARTAAAAPIAMVRPIDPTRLSALRWILLAGFPIATLLVGIIYRRAT